MKLAEAKNNLSLAGLTGRVEITSYFDERRVIQCSACGEGQKVSDAKRNGAFCASCSASLCVFCGCTEEAGCVHPEFPNGDFTCSWADKGLCDFCLFKINEETYLIATGRGSVVRARYAEPAIVIAAGLRL